MLNDIAERMRLQLSRYPTTLEEDLTVLAAGTYPFGSDRRNAMVIIRGEKEVCHHFIKLAEVCVPLLAMDVSVTSSAWWLL